MESFLLFCNGSLMVLIVVLTIMDDRRKRGEPRRSPFRINLAVSPAVSKRIAKYVRPQPTRRKRRA